MIEWMDIQSITGIQKETNDILRNGLSMTLPIERTNAVLNVERFLMDLRDPKKTPRVPSEVRKRASSLLKHYPSKFDMMDPAERFEPITEWSYEEDT